MWLINVDSTLLPPVFGIGGTEDMWVDAGTCEVGTKGDPPCPWPWELGGVTPVGGLGGVPGPTWENGSAPCIPVLANKEAGSDDELPDDPGGGL